MKRTICLLLACVLALTACGLKAEALTWQEQYDLGVRYLSEGNYEEAVLAFNAAIEIDAMRPEAYVGLAETHVQMGDKETAKAFLEDAIALLGEEELLLQALEKYASDTPAAGLTDEQDPERHPTINDEKPLPEPQVINAYYEEIHGYKFAIPKVKMTGVSVKEANDKMHSDLYPYMEKLKNNGDGQIQGGPYGMSYFGNVYEDVVSIVVKVGEWNGGESMFYSYNISTKTGNLLTLPQLLQYFNMNEDVFYEKAKTVMMGEIDYIEILADEPSYELLQLREETFQMSVEATTSPENLARIRPYINENGRLCMAAQIETLPGMGFRYSLYDVETGEKYEMPAG